MTDQVRLSRQAVATFAARRKPGYEAALIAAAITSDERSVTITRSEYDRLRDKFGTTCGPGCQLRRTLSWFVRDDGTCGCHEYAAHMDAWGPDGCEERLDEIVAHLREQAVKRSVVLGMVPAAAVIPMVRRAIAAARAEATPATPPPG
jgi:hypothetical protein